MPICALRLLSMHLAQHWLMALIISMLTVFAASYFYFTTTHSLEIFDSGSCTPLVLDLPESSENCVSSLQSSLNNDQPYPVIAVGGHFGGQTQQSVIKFQAAHQAHGWVDKFLCVILIGFAAAFLELLAEMFALSAFTDPPSPATEPRIEADYGS